MDIYTELKSDHRKFKTLLRKLDATTEKSLKRRESLLKQLKLGLVPHARAEEKVLYDRLKESSIKEADALAFEGYEEHAVVDRLMTELEATQPNDKKWTAMMAVVKEALEHHIEEEEEEIFAKAKQTFEHLQAVEMREEFLTIKRGLTEDVAHGETPAQPPSHELVSARTRAA